METSCNFIKFKNNRPFKWFCLIGKKLGCTHLNSILVDHNEDNVGLVNYGEDCLLHLNIELNMIHPKSLLEQFSFLIDF